MLERFFGKQNILFPQHREHVKILLHRWLWAHRPQEVCFWCFLRALVDGPAGLGGYRDRSRTHHDIEIWFCCVGRAVHLEPVQSQGSFRTHEDIFLKRDVLLLQWLLTSVKGPLRQENIIDCLIQRVSGGKRGLFLRALVDAPARSAAHGLILRPQGCLVGEGQGGQRMSAAITAALGQRKPLSPLSQRHTLANDRALSSHAALRQLRRLLLHWTLLDDWTAGKQDTSASDTLADTAERTETKPQLKL